MLDHFFIDSCNGDLHDTRRPDWSHNPLRKAYRRSCPEIRTVAEFKATLRAGAYAWPGGYPLYLITSDGGPLCFDCGRKEARNIFEAIDRKDGSGWRVLATDINYEDGELTCEHCNKRIESAYAD